MVLGQAPTGIPERVVKQRVGLRRFAAGGAGKGREGPIGPIGPIGREETRGGPLSPGGPVRLE